MRNGISGASVPLDLLYAGDINAASLKANTSPILAYAIAKIETIDGQVDGLWPSALTVISGDNGHGLMQPTPADWWTPELNFEWAAIDWQNGYQNALFCCTYFINPAENFWVANYDETGVSLVRCIAAEYNAGRNNALKGHVAGDVGIYTEHQNGVSYSDHVAANYSNLLAQIPDA